MNGLLLALLIIALLLTLGVLFLGLFSMARGGEFNRKYGNVFMRFRVAAQAITILLVLIIIFVMSRGN